MLALDSFGAANKNSAAEIRSDCYSALGVSDYAIL
jgi:hypothetical protein